MGGEATTQDDKIQSAKLEQPSRKQPGSVSGIGSGGFGDRLKRDEWSEGAVTTLLEAYESKWILRNRAKLKGQDWEDVAKCVSSRASNTKSPKTQTQCKNKIESMKKRYRSESASADTSSWPLFSKLDHLLRGTGVSNHGSVPAQPLLLPCPVPALESSPVSQPLLLCQQPVSSPAAQLHATPQQRPVAMAQSNSQESDDVDPMVKGNDGAANSSDQVSNKDNMNNRHLETDTSTPALYSNDIEDLENKKKMTMKRKRRRRSDCSGREEIAESIRWLADAVVRSEQARMDTMKEVERMRIEAEAKRGEMDLKRTEIVANTQLEIARLFASIVAGKSVDPSLKIGKS